MQTKLKTCFGCSELKVIWKNYEGNKYCARCWYLVNPNPKVIKPKSAQIANTSAKKMVQLRIYRLERDDYFRANPVCEFPGCSSTEITLHHKKGRSGRLLTDRRYFCSLCQHHHQWVETHPNEAQELKLSFKRLNID